MIFLRTCTNIVFIYVESITAKTLCQALYVEKIISASPIVNKLE